MANAQSPCPGSFAVAIKTQQDNFQLLRVSSVCTLLSLWCTCFLVHKSISTSAACYVKSACACLSWHTVHKPYTISISILLLKPSLLAHMPFHPSGCCNRQACHVYPLLCVACTSMSRGQCLQQTDIRATVRSYVAVCLWSWQILRAHGQAAFSLAIRTQQDTVWLLHVSCVCTLLSLWVTCLVHSPSAQLQLHHSLSHRSCS